MNTARENAQPSAFSSRYLGQGFLHMFNSRRFLTAAIGALTLTASSLAVAPGAHADTVWQVGVEVSNPGTTDGEVNSFPEDGYPCDSGGSVEATAAVKLAGDYIFVKDTCKDGRSAIARITGQEDGHFHTRICRNKLGKGTWVRCNFDWPEKPMKYLAAGVYNADTGYMHVDNAASMPFVD